MAAACRTSLLIHRRALGAGEAVRPRPWSGAIAGFVPVPMGARVGVLSQDEHTADPAREVPVGERVEDFRHRPLRVR
jgi:hypothetical protein